MFPAAHGVVSQGGRGSAPAPDQPLPVTEGLVAHYDAAALALANQAPVALWPDLSGNGNHLTQATGTQQPVFVAAAQNGRGVVEFDGENDHFEDFTEDQVVWGIVTGDDERTIVAITSTIEDLSPAARHLTGAQLTGNLRYGEIAFRSVENEQIMVGRGSSFSAFLTGGNVTNPQVLVVSYKGSSSPGVWAYQNAALLGSAPTAGGFTSDTSKRNFRRGQTGNFFKGRVCEILVYNRILSDVERGDVEAYAAGKWGVVL